MEDKHKCGALTHRSNYSQRWK